MMKSLQLGEIHFKLSSRTNLLGKTIERFARPFKWFYLALIYIYSYTVWRDSIVLIRGSILTKKWSPLLSDIDLTLFDGGRWKKEWSIKLFKILAPHAREIEVYNEEMFEEFMIGHCLYANELNTIKTIGRRCDTFTIDDYTKEHFILNLFFFSYFTTARSLRIDHERYGRANLKKLKRNIIKIHQRLDLLENHLTSRYRYQGGERLISRRLDSIDLFIEKRSLVTSTAIEVKIPLNDNKTIYETNFYRIMNHQRRIFTSTDRNSLYLPINFFTHLYKIGIIDPIVIYRHLIDYNIDQRNKLKKIWDVIYYTWPYLKEEIKGES